MINEVENVQLYFIINLMELKHGRSSVVFSIRLYCPLLVIFENTVEVLHLIFYTALKYGIPFLL